MADYTLSAKITGDADSFKKACANAKKATDEIKGKVSSVGQGTERVSKKSAAAVGKSLNDIAKENGKTVNEVRSDVAKIAAEYRKQGKSASESMRQAYSDIGFVATEKTKKINSDTKGIGVLSKNTAKSISGIRDSFNSAGSASAKMSQKAVSALEKIKSKTVEVSKKIKSIGDNFKTVGDKLTSSITKPALVATTALAGVTLGKGFARLTAIDTAKAKLEALGNSAENVTNIMKSANASVKGTSYGLDEAATTASSAVAAGIKPGQELTRYLSLTADAAATAGRTMSDMGSIFNKVQTSQAAYTEELNQLADSGIPIYQWLGEEAGLSAAQIKEMASEGKITSEMFLGAVEKNIGGAAKIVGEKSFTGALSNIGASVGRIGANFLDANGSGQGFFTQMKPLMVEFKNYLGTLEEKSAAWGQVFGETFSGVIQYFKTGKAEIDGFTDTAANIVTKLQPVIDVVKKVAEKFSALSPAMKIGLVGGVVAAGPLISILGKVAKVSGLIIGVVGKLAPLFGCLFSPIGLVTASIVALGTGVGVLINKHLKNTQGITLFDYLKDKCSNSFESIKSSVTSGINTYKSEMSAGYGAGNALSESISVCSGNLSKAFPQIGGLIKSVGSAVSSVAPSIAPVFEKLKTEATNAPAALKSGISSAMGTYKAEISAGYAPQQALFDALTVGIGGIKKECPLLGSVISSAFNTFKSVISVVQPIFNTLKECVATFISSLQSGFSEAGGGADGLASAFSMISFALNPVMGIIKNFAPQIQLLISVVGKNLVPIFSTLGYTIGTISAQILPVLSSAISSIITVAVSMLGQIMPMLTNIVSQLLPAITQVISQLLPVVTNVLGAILPIISKVISFIAQLAKSLLPMITKVISALLPVVSTVLTTVMTLIQQILPVITNIAATLLPVIFDIITQLMPVVTELITIISNLFVSLMPIVTQIMSAMLPLVTNIITVVANAVQSVLPAVVAIINVIMSVIKALMPVITMIICVVADVISNIINIITPIISIIGGIISAIMTVVTPVITFIANVIATIITYITPIIEFVTGVVSTIFNIVSNVIGGISGFISGVVNTISGIISKLTGIFSGIFNKVYGVVKGIMDKVSGVFKTVIGAIQKAWGGLTGFVSGIFDGIKNAFDTVINSVKGAINIVIDGINGAIGLINLIPGVEIQPIQHLAHGTDDWQGGFAYMNEGGRGELVNLPNGSQVIPHDISVHYAKEAARANSSMNFVIDYDYLINGIAAAMGNINVRHTSTIDGKVVSDTTSPLVDNNLAVSAMLERRYA